MNVFRQFLKHIKLNNHLNPQNEKIFNMKKYITTVLTLFIVLTSFADIRLPSVLSSNMVLQQKSTVKLWGWCSPAEKIAVITSWNNKTDSVVGTRDANWEINGMNENGTHENDRNNKKEWFAFSLTFRQLGEMSFL